MHAIPGAAAGAQHRRQPAQGDREFLSWLGSPAAALCPGAAMSERGAAGPRPRQAQLRPGSGELAHLRPRRPGNDYLRMRQCRRAAARQYQRRRLMAQAPTFDANKNWLNFHQSYAQLNEGTWDLYFPQTAPGTTSIEDFRETTRQMQALLGEARKKGLKVRAQGSRWSLSHAPATNGWAINTNRLRGKMKVSAADLDPAYPGSADQKAGLYLFQCGNTVADV